jgi:tetratricopeptide repeat protein 30
MGSEHPDNVITISNSEVLHQSHLIEAFNLKAAVEYTLKNYTAAKEAIRDMPPRQEQDLDPISLHNLAVTQFEDDSTAGYDKLRFLISLNPAPAETLHNILVFFLKNQFYDAAADLIAQFAASTNDLLEPVRNYHMLFKILVKKM